ncbi:MAG: adenosylcobinamide-GDP ribazoletransferase, partial [Pseudomonadota bacterium]
MTDRLAELRAALMLLTRLPVWPGDAPPPVSRALWAFPLAGLAVGALALLVWQGAQGLDLPPAMAAVLALATMVLATGGLHEDGLADCADGLWGGRDRARRLAIMRDSRIGTYGTLALVLSLAIRGAGIVALGAGAGLALLLVSGASRAAPALLLATLPAAREDGLGHAASAG